MATDTDFAQAFDLLIGHEGGFTDNPKDPGNWTGGKVNEGQLKGTKYGISAASYPSLDIKNLTVDQAKEIYRRDFWAKAGCPDCSPRLAFTVFDAAVNNGVGRAVRWLQGAVGTTQDGSYGSGSKAAVQKAVAKDSLDMTLAQEVHAQRIFFMASLSTWKDFGLGWSRRLAMIPAQGGHYWSV